MSAEERMYALLLRSYPQAFRARYAQQMVVVFRDLQRSRSNRAQFWSVIVWDTIRSAPTLRLEALRSQWSGHPNANGGTMKTIAIVAVLIGFLEVVNASIEGWAGGVVGHDSTSLLASCLGLIGGVVIIAAGVAMLRRAPGAAALARGAAVVCLATFVLTLAVAPRFSVFANILGIGFPIVLLAAVQFRGGRGQPAPRPV